MRRLWTHTVKQDVPQTEHRNCHAAVQLEVARVVIELEISPRNRLTRLVNRLDNHVASVRFESEVRFQLVYGDTVELPSALVTEPPAEHENHQAVCLYVPQGQEPRIARQPFNIDRRQVKLDPVAPAMLACQHVNVFQRPATAVKRPIERGAGLLAKQFGKTPAVQFNDTRFHLAVQNVPSQAEEGLEPDKSQCIGAVILDRIRQVEPEHTGDGCPVLHPESGGGFDGYPAGVLLAVALGTQRNTFHMVVAVHGQGVIVGFRGVAVEIPQAKQDMVEADNMVALKLSFRVTPETPCGPIPPHPILIDLGSPNAMLKMSQLTRKVHALLYTQEHDLRYQNMGFVMHPDGKKPLQRRLRRVYSRVYLY